MTAQIPHAEWLAQMYAMHPPLPDHDINLHGPTAIQLADAWGVFKQTAKRRADQKVEAGEWEATQVRCHKAEATAYRPVTHGKAKRIEK